MTLRKVQFQAVSAIAHPEYYDGDYPRVRAEQVPDEHWSTIEREGDGVEDQYQGLLEIMASGELVRNPKLFEATDPTWTEVTP